MLHYNPEPSATGYPRSPSRLAVAKDAMCADLLPHIREFDAIVSAGDFHGMALGSVAAAALWKPLMLVCAKSHDDVVSHIVCIGDIHPEMRFLYLDDFFAFGASLAHVMAYMNQSKKANIVATYEYVTRDYQVIPG